MQHGAIFGGHIACVEDVLDADGYAVQRTGHLAARTLRINGARLRARVLRVEIGPGFDRRIGFRDPGEAGFHKLLCSYNFV